MTQKEAVTIRPATPNDAPFLWRVLTFAASMEGHADDVTRAQSDPDLRLFVDDYGRDGDVGGVSLVMFRRSAHAAGFSHSISKK